MSSWLLCRLYLPENPLCKRGDRGFSRCKDVNPVK